MEVLMRKYVVLAILVTIICSMIISPEFLKAVKWLLVALAEGASAIKG